jgi:hypothetical protein
MEVSGCLYAPSVLASEKASLIPIVQGAGWALEPVGRDRETNTCPAGNSNPVVQYVALSLYCLTYSAKFHEILDLN